MFNSNNAMRPFLYSIPDLETIALVHFRFNQKRLAGVESVMHVQKKLLERSGRRTLVDETDLETDCIVYEPIENTIQTPLILADLAPQFFTFQVILQRMLDLLDFSSFTSESVPFEIEFDANPCRPSISIEPSPSADIIYHNLYWEYILSLIIDALFQDTFYSYYLVYHLLI